MTMARMKPAEWDRDTGPFFAAARERRLIYRHCHHCGRGTHPPTVACRFCGSTDTAWRDSAGRGTLFSWTLVTHQVHPAYPVPYTIVVVALDEAPDVRLIGRIDDDAPRRAGEPMTVWFEDIGEGQLLPNWRPIEETQA